MFFKKKLKCSGLVDDSDGLRVHGSILKMFGMQ
jgi:hypothetical protein